MTDNDAKTLAAISAFGDEADRKLTAAFQTHRDADALERHYTALITSLLELEPEGRFDSDLPSEVSEAIDTVLAHYSTLRQEAVAAESVAFEALEAAKGAVEAADALYADAGGLLPRIPF
jgi:hypothetical protein